MTEKETQKKTSPEASDETKNTESKEELTIPKTRFDEVNTKAKELEKQLKALEVEKAEREKKELAEKENFKELAEKLEAENNQLKLSGLKRDLIQEAINNKEMHPRLAKMVQGSTEDEIKQSLEETKQYNKELLESMKGDLTATDDARKGGGTKASPMTADEWMALYEKDPKSADSILAKLTEQK